MSDQHRRACGVQRRINSNSIYRPLLRELNKEACLIAAYVFAGLIKKEKQLYAYKIIFVRMQDKLELLHGLIKQMKKANKAASLENCAGTKAAMDAMYQCMLLINEYGTAFDWLLKVACELIIELALQERARHIFCKEVMAAVYFKYGMCISKDSKDIEEAIACLAKAMKIARGQNWFSNPDEWWSDENLHMIIGRALAEILLKYAKDMEAIDVLKSIRITARMISVISEVGMKKNQILFQRANMQLAALIGRTENTVAALKLLSRIESNVRRLGDDAETCVFRSELFLRQGVYWFNEKENDNAFEKLSAALALSVQYKIKFIEAECLLYLGKLFANKRQDFSRARKSFNKAKELFSELSDTLNAEKAKYSLASLNSAETFSHYIDLTKSADSNPGAMYHLGQLKYQLRPFMNRMKADLADDTDIVKCLLDENNEFPVKNRYKKQASDYPAYKFKLAVIVNDPLVNPPIMGLDESYENPQNDETKKNYHV